jgi:hypothetical protein
MQGEERKVRRSKEGREDGKKRERKNWRLHEPVAHTCNLSHSGGRDQEDHGSKPVLGK